MRVLLTGATGFLGSHLLKALVSKGYEVVVLKRSTSDMWRLKGFENAFKSYDIDRVPLQTAFEEQPIDTVIHTACVYGRKGESIQKILETNLMFGIELLNTAINFNTRIFFNTGTLLDRQINAYALSKNQFEEWLQVASDKIQVINLKLEHMFGEQDGNDKFTTWILNELKREKPTIPLTAGTQKRDFIYIDDVVSAYLTCLEQATQLKAFNDIEVGTGVLTPVKTFVTLVKSTLEKLKGSPIESQLNFGALPYREGEIMEPQVDNSVLCSLGWQPKRSLEENIKTFVKNEIQ
ncbi:NAD(P)-dependent oxidoreductase [Capnocytophaga leadbetteri]|uniref:NAD-dependent epimerase/dehydratase family protein n=1 Tax=Capnocytophaga leadbetteri TaxID=327575 RepID=UPI0028E1FCE4|nr:NAD(P)-dependent oxidoreductase [Capnocytophaga leadbetteri]